MGAHVTIAFVGPHATVEQVGDAVASIAPEFAPLRDVILSKGIHGGALFGRGRVEEVAELITQDRLQRIVMISHYHRLTGWCHSTPAFAAPAAAAAPAPAAADSLHILRSRNSFLIFILKCPFVQLF